jgi:hypothetical protein
MTPRCPPAPANLPPCPHSELPLRGRAGDEFNPARVERVPVGGVAEIFEEGNRYGCPRSPLGNPHTALI